MSRNSSRYHHAGRADGDHRPGLSACDDRDRRRDLSQTGARQPDREGRQGGRFGPDRAGVQERQIFPRPALGDSAPDPADSTKTVSAPYNAANSGGSNLGPTSKALADRIKEDVEKLKAENPSASVPVDLVTSSASGLDPDISPEARPVPGAAGGKARKMPEERVRQLVAEHTRAAWQDCWASHGLTFWRSIWRWIQPRK